MTGNIIATLFVCLLPAGLILVIAGLIIEQIKDSSIIKWIGIICLCIYVTISIGVNVIELIYFIWK